MIDLRNINESIHQRPEVRIVADASIYDRFKISTYGCWIESDVKNIVTHSGILNYCKSSVVSEMNALLQAIRIAKSGGYITEKTRCIILYSDNLNALGILARMPNAVITKVKAGNKYDQKIEMRRSIRGPYSEFCNELVELKLVYLRHVKAHTPEGGIEHLIHENCDRLAKEAAQFFIRDVYFGKEHNNG